MTRRMLDSAIFQNEKFATMPPMARLLTIGIINQADDQGRGKAHPVYLRSQVFPYDDVTPGDVSAWLDLIVQNGTVTVYSANGKSYYQVINWWKYQTHQYAMPSQFPKPPDWRDRVRKSLTKGQIVTCNWITTDGRPSPDTCNEQGLAIHLNNQPDDYPFIQVNDQVDEYLDEYPVIQVDNQVIDHLDEEPPIQVNDQVIDQVDDEVKIQYKLKFNYNIISAEKIPAELSADADANFASQEPKPNGEAKPRAKAKVEKPKGAEKPGTHRELVSKLIDVCGWDRSSLMPSNYSLLGKVAKNLAAIGATPTVLDDFLAWWWKEDFRGIAKQRPTPPLIESVWPLFSARRQIVKPPQSKTIRIIDPLTGKTIEVDSSTGT